jgi:hypothetical protein
MTVRQRIARYGVVLTPAAALATAAVSLRAGATEPIVAAVVYGTAPAQEDERLVWQVFTGVEDGRRQQGMAVDRLTVLARSNGREAVWRGATNEAGVAWATLALRGVRVGDPVEIVVSRAGEEAAPLARGAATWGAAAKAPPGGQTQAVDAVPFRPFGARDGSLKLEVALDGAAIGASAPAALWVRATDAATHARAAGAAIEATPMLAVQIDTPHAETDARGWARLDVRAPKGGGGVTLSALDHQGHGGTWTGLLPVDPAVARIDVPARVTPNASVAVGIDVPAGAAPAAYVEVHDRAGVAAASVLDVSHGAATFEVPPLTEGARWISVTTDPRATGGATTRAFFVAATDAAALALGPDGSPACDAAGGEVAPCAAMTAPAASPRWTALDGFVARRDADAAVHRRARLVAVLALAAAALLESIFIVLVFQEAHRRARRAEAASPEMAKARARPPVLLLAASLAVTLVGFGVMAALVMR